MPDYRYLKALPAEAYLKPENFITETDNLPGPLYKSEQYLKGLDISRKAKRVFISSGSVWGADMKDGSYLTSYEGIGYHSCTADLLRGFLDGSAEIVVYREKDGVCSSTVIQKSLIRVSE